MSLGQVFLLLACCVFFLVLIDVLFMPQQLVLGFFLLALGLAVGAYTPWK